MTPKPSQDPNDPILPPNLPLPPSDEDQATIASLTNTKPVDPRSILGDQVAPGESIPGSKMHEAGKMAYASLMPKITANPGSTDYFRQRQEQIEFEKNHPYGAPISKHPGTFGTILHGLAKAGNIAGDILAPGTMSLIPGTDLNRRGQELENIAGIEHGQAEDAKEQEAKAAETNAEARTKIEQQNADTAANAEKNKENQAEPLFDKAGNVMGFKTAKGLLAADSPDITDDMRKMAQSAKTPAEKLPVEQQYINDFLTKNPGKTLADAVRQYAKDSQRPEQPGANDARSDRSYQYNQGRLDKLRTPVDQINQRIGRLTDTLNQKNPQADALVAPELLSIMAGGQGSGLRMNEAEIERIVGGRSAWENLKGKMQHWATDPNAARSITPDQDRQIRALVQEVGSKLSRKAQVLDAAQEKLLDSTDPGEHRRIVAETQRELDAIDNGGATTNAAPQSQTGDGQTATGPNGQKIVVRGGKWVDASTGKPIQ